MADTATDVLGVLVLKAEEDALLLENVAVAPARQKQGVGRALIAFAEDHAFARVVGDQALYQRADAGELAPLPTARIHRTERRVEDGFARVYFQKVLR